jgi:prophage tail gpP-like protein
MSTATKKPQVVTLSVAGQMHGDWTNLWVDSDLKIPADAFEFGLGLQHKSRLPADVRKGARVQVRIDDVVVMQGRLDARTHKLSRVGGGASHCVTLRGRDDAASLLDCSAPIKSTQKLNLMQVVEQMVKPLGISKIKFLGDKQYTHDKISVEPGESGADVLNKACEANGVAWWIAPDGTLTIGGPDYEAPPVATLRLKYEQNLTNVEEVEEEDCIDGVYSELTILGQSHGGKKGKGANQKAHATDPNIDWYRPKIVVDPDIQDAAVAATRSKKLMADGRLGGYTLKVIVNGFYTEGGVLWAAGQRIECDFEPLDTHAVFFLMARRFYVNRGCGGKYTQLTIKEDKMWVPDAKKPKSGGKKARKVRKSIDKDLT